MNIVNKKDNPKEFDILFKVLKNIDYEDIISDHRKGNTFWNEAIINVDNDYSDINELNGYWKSDRFISSDYDGWDLDNVNNFYRVEPKDVVITKRIWEIVK